MTTRVRLPRVALGLFYVFLAVAPFVVAARSAPGMPAFLAVPLAAAGGLVSAIVLGSLGEWLVHRYFMHRSWPSILNTPYVLHHVAHHWHHYTPDRYLHDGPVKYHPVGDPYAVCATNRGRFLVAASQILFYLSFGIVFLFVPMWALTTNPVFVASFVVTILAECFLFLRVHDVIHHPADRWMERRRWFRFLNRHHYIHHVDTGANTNFLLPLCDLLFGTLRRELDPRETARWGDFEVATASRVPEGDAAAAPPSRRAKKRTPAARV